jgi:hypothetical protein
MAAMVAAGFLPFLAFVIERRVERRVRDVLDDPVGGGWGRWGSPRAGDESATPTS